MDNLTRLDYYEIGRQYVRSRAKRIDPAQIDIEGSDVNLMVGSTSFMTFAVQRQLGERMNALFLDGCEGEDLDRWGFDRYRLLRKGASPARTILNFARSSTGVGSGNVESGRKFITTTGIEYVTTQTALFSGTTVSASVYARAVQAGKDFQVGANAIRKPSAGTLFDPSIIISNPTAAAGGEPRESDDVFRERIRDFWRAMSRGTLGAIEYGARTVPGIESAMALEVLDNGMPARLVQLAVSDSSGVSSKALEASVDIELDEWRGAGVYVLLSGGIPQIIDRLTLHLTFTAGVDTSTLTLEVLNAVVDYVNSLGIGQPLYVANLRSVLARFQTSGLIPRQDTIVDPVGDIVPIQGRTLRIRPENVSFV
jgi:uncharacterized phage protein gp47/JayE